ncbi:MAG: PadR family transcriptional regulator [Holophagales bacterium]|nr:PadR family transcriptional regulator [Holophagales bacterium]
MPSTALRPTDFHVLLGLAREPLHGYRLARRIEQESEGRVRLLPGNLYAILARLEEKSWVRQTEPGAAPEDHDQRRRYFELTADGRRVLDEETRRLERLLRSVRARRLLDGHDGGATP